MLERWTDLVVQQEHFYHALLYVLLLLVIAVSFLCYYRARQLEHRKKLESPRSDINGYKYYTPSSEE